MAQKPPANDTPSFDASIDRIFLTDDTLPDAAAAFGQEVMSVEEVIKDADIVLDTNVLLLPYGAGSESLANIIAKFGNLVKEKRLYLPAQVAREFIRNRPAKLAELQQQLTDKVSKFQSAEKLRFPVLEGLREYEELTKILEKTVQIKKELLDANSKLIKTVRSWEWNDPVARGYRNVFDRNTIVQPAYDRSDVLLELQRRLRLKIPPGYKDGSKEDLGIGDFLIWKTILDIGQKNKKPLVFVSGDEKTDWQHRSSSGAFLPRFELLDEYRRVSGGRAFYIIPFSKLLELLDVSVELVEEIKQVEERAHSETMHTVTVRCPYCETTCCFRMDGQASVTSRKCENCANTFVAKRKNDGSVSVRRHLFAPSSDTVALKNFREMLRHRNFAEAPPPVSAACPNCGLHTEVALPSMPDSNTWCLCRGCDTGFLVRRTTDGSFFTEIPPDSGDGNVLS